MLITDQVATAPCTDAIQAGFGIREETFVPTLARRVFVGFPNKSINQRPGAHLISPVFCHTCSPASSVERAQQVDYLPHKLPIHRNRAFFQAFIADLTLPCCWHNGCTHGGALEMLP